MLAIYTRLSKEDDESNSLKNQLREGKLFAKKNNFNNVKIYDEGQGISGGLEIENRPQLKALKDDVLNGTITNIWFRNQNRLERNGITFHEFVAVVQKFKVNVYFGDKLTDYTDANAYLQSSIISSLNTYTRQLQSQQTIKAIKNNFEEGKVHGISPYGYTKDKHRFMVIDEEEAKIVERIYDMSLNGIGTNKIAEKLNEDNIPTRYNKIGKGTITTKDKNSGKIRITNKKDIKWSGNTIRSIIKNTIYKGVRISHKKSKDDADKIEYKSPKIIEPIKWKQVNDNLEKNRNNSGKLVSHKYLLKGLLTCGKCTRNYYGRTRVNKKDNYYMCSSKRYKDKNCGNRSINIDALENFIWTRFFVDKEFKNLIVKHFENNETEHALERINNDLERLNKDLIANDKQMRNVVRLAVDGVLTDAELLPEKKRIKNEKLDLEIKIKNLNEQKQSFQIISENILDIVDSLNSIKSNAKFENKKELFKKYIKEITILYKDKIAYLEIEFNILNIENEHYLLFRMGNKYPIAIEMKKEIMIPLIWDINEFDSEQLKKSASVFVKQLRSI